MKWSTLVPVTLLWSACGGATSQDLFDPADGGASGASGSSSRAGSSGSGTSGAGKGGSAGTAGSFAGSGGMVAGTAGQGMGGVSAGTGGVGPSAGHAGGGAGGRGGSMSGGAAGKTNCEELLANVARLLPAAQACNDTMGRLPCTGFVQDQCGCRVPVDVMTSMTSRAYTEAVATALSQCLVSCPPVGCPTGTRATCENRNEQGIGTCVLVTGANTL